MSRTSKEDWLQEGLQVLAQAGMDGLTIERMAGDLGLTKGSFYHHFDNVQDFEQQLVAYWAKQYLSTSTSLPKEPAERLTLLDTIMREAFSTVTGPEVAMRAWAHQNEMVRSSVERVDAARSEFIRKVFLSLTGEERQAHLMTDILTTMLVGSFTILPRIPPERVLELYTEFKRLYDLDKRARGKPQQIPLFQD